MDFKSITKEFCLKHSSEEAFLKLENYVSMIEEKNKTMNLTGFTGNRLWEEGIYESIISLFTIWKKSKPINIVDIGAGVGFPSIPFLIAFPQVALTIIEPQLKRVNFLKEVAKNLDLNIQIIIERAEEVKGNTFDLITARAVAPLYALLEISTHLGHLGSEYAFLKGSNIDEEIKQSLTIIKQLRIDNHETIKLSDQLEKHQSAIFYYKKENETPTGFPRQWQKIIKDK